MTKMLGTVLISSSKDETPGRDIKTYDQRMPLTAEEAWFQEQCFNPSSGRLPPNVARKAKERMARRKWVLCNDGIYRFKMQPKG